MSTPTKEWTPPPHAGVSFRWHAVAVYQTPHGVIDVEYDFDELVELHNLIERGPDCGSLVGVTVTYVGYLRPDMTLTLTEAAPDKGGLTALVNAHYAKARDADPGP